MCGNLQHGMAWRYGRFSSMAVCGGKRRGGRSHMWILMMGWFSSYWPSRLRSTGPVLNKGFARSGQVRYVAYAWMHGLATGMDELVLDVPCTWQWW